MAVSVEVCVLVRHCATLLVKVLYSLAVLYFLAVSLESLTRDYIMTIILLLICIFPYVECRSENCEDSTHTLEVGVLKKIPFKDSI